VKTKPVGCCAVLQPKANSSCAARDVALSTNPPIKTRTKRAKHVLRDNNHARVFLVCAVRRTLSLSAFHVHTQSLCVLLPPACPLANSRQAGYYHETENDKENNRAGGGLEPRRAGPKKPKNRRTGTQRRRRTRATRAMMMTVTRKKKARICETL